MSNKKNIVNIRGSTEINDPFYRYQMESVEIVKQGAKFAFTNIDSICNALCREPIHLISFLKKYYGSAFEYKNGIATTTKKDLTKQELQTAIYKYIDDNILCKKCKNPETEILTDKKKSYIVCKACSYKLEL